MRMVGPQPGFPRIAGLDGPAKPSGEPAFHALPLFRKLANLLPDAIEFHGECTARHEQSVQARGGHVTFLNDREQLSNAIPTSIIEAVARDDGDRASAWTILPDLIDDAITLLGVSNHVRRAARAVPGLTETAKRAIGLLPSCGVLADILTMPEDETVLVIDPIAMVGLRVRIRGLATIAEFHTFLAEIWPVAGPKPGRAAIAAYRQLTLAEPPVVTARFQMYDPRILKRSTSLSLGFDGSDAWLWADRPLASIPRVAFERTIVVGPPVYAAKWQAIRTLPFPAEPLDVIETWGESEIREWLTATGTRPEFGPLREAA